MHPAHSVPHAWADHEFAVTLLMWLCMTVAMMLPTATPAIRAFAGIVASDRGPQRQSGVGAFVGGYLAIWAGFGLLATAAQWSLAALARRVPAPHLDDSPALAGCCSSWQACTSSPPSRRAVSASAAVRWRSSSRTGAPVSAVRSGSGCDTECIAWAVAGH